MLCGHTVLAFATRLLFVAALPLAVGNADAAERDQIDFVTPLAHDGGVKMIAAQGDVIASGDDLGTLRVWRDGEPPSPVAVYRLDDDAQITAGAFRPSSGHVIALSVVPEQDYERARIVLFDLRAGQEIAGWPGYANRLVFSPDGRFLAGKAFSALSVWEVDLGTLYVELAGADDNGVAFADATTVVYRDEGVFSFLDIKTGDIVRRVAADLGKDFALADSGRLFDLTSDGYRVLTVDSTDTAGERPGFSHDRVAMAPDGSLAIAASDAALMFGDTRFPVSIYTGGELETESIVVGLTSNADALLIHDHTFMVGHRDGRIRRWRFDTERAGGPALEALEDLGRASAPVTAIAQSSDGRYLALGRGDSPIDIVDVLANRRWTIDPYGVRLPPPSPNFCEDGDFGLKCIAQVFRVSGGFQGQVTSILFKDRGDILRVVHEDGTVRDLDVIGRGEIARLESGEDERLRTGLQRTSRGGMMIASDAGAIRWDADGAVVREPLQSHGEAGILVDVAVDARSGQMASLHYWSGDGAYMKLVLPEGDPVEAQSCVRSLGRDQYVTLKDASTIAVYDRAGRVLSERAVVLGHVTPQTCVAQGRTVAILDADGRGSIADYAADGTVDSAVELDVGFPVASAAFSADERLLLAGGSNGRVAIRSVEDGRLEAEFVSFEDDGWLALTDRLFDAPNELWSEIVVTESDDHLATVEGGTLLEVAVAPGLMQQVLSGAPLPEPSGAPLGTLTAPPRVVIESPEPTIRIGGGLGGGGTARISSGDRTLELPSISIGQANTTVAAGIPLGDAARRNVPVRIRVHDQGSGIGDCRVLRNRQVAHVFPAPAPTAAGLTEGGGLVLETTIAIGRGETELAAYCFSSDGRPGQVHRIAMAAASSQAPIGTAYVIAIGVNEYDNVEPDLRYAEADADLFAGGVAEALRATSRYAAVREVAIKGTAAPAERIAAVMSRLSGGAGETDPTLDELAATGPDDAVLLFLAGHGAFVDGEYRFLLSGHDEKAARGDYLTEKDIAGFFRKLGATDLVLVIDACHSDAAIAAAGGARTGPFDATSFLQATYDKGVFFLAAAAAQDVALESRSIGHGFLTSALVDTGLRAGYADRSPADGIITVREFLEFPVVEVPLLHAAAKRGMPLDSSNALSARGAISADDAYLQTPMTHLPKNGFNSQFVLDNKSKPVHP